MICRAVPLILILKPIYRIKSDHNRLVGSFYHGARDVVISQYSAYEFNQV